MSPCIRFLSAGESHGPKINLIIEGFPAQVPLQAELLQADLARRQQGFGRSARMKMEKDEAIFTAGIAQGKSTGAPIAVEILNADYENWRSRPIAPMTIPRPGHADLCGALKYNHFDLRLSLERSSARETAMRVVLGSLCKQLLAHFGIRIGGYVIGIGTISHEPTLSPSAQIYEQRILHAAQNDFSFIDSQLCELVHQEIFAAMKSKDTLGGILEVVALQVPVGLGSYAHYDRRLEAQLAQALMSIPAIKGVTFGEAFADAKRRGTQVHDEINLGENGELLRSTNQAAGIEGGISTGLPIVMRAAMKPISTTLTPRKTVDLFAAKESYTNYERSDFCAVTRALVVGEAMMAFVIANALMEKLGGDTLEEMQIRFKSLARCNLNSLNLSGEPWHFSYDL